jgi:hypothetical protein
MVGNYPIRQLVLYENDFGWMAFWELNPEVLELLWLMTYSTLEGGGVTLAEGLHDWGNAVFYVNSGPL